MSSECAGLPVLDPLLGGGGRPAPALDLTPGGRAEGTPVRNAGTGETDANLVLSSRAISSHFRLALPSGARMCCTL